ncbi:hypothetical protein HXX76_015274 [Chlamydomonas incerta]|uniref:Protein kinase domain-containing protein n=1 Tax=Chlamydomonas incerta TaxID=51695 RepID=A0A835SDH9_CHLIN|nr:hypothetical protein HXX76_015274 [Chlamydomonas incerta]|eukprot:KAG2423526.1 hypothetical protein HXX76_015274 [Chlamydomonas incerta]
MCAGGSLLPDGRPGSILHFETIIPLFSHISIALPDIANAIIEGYGLTSDPDQEGYNLWVWDSARTCRAFWFDLETSMFSATDVSCDWLLGFTCVDAEAAERRGWQTSLPWYRSYLASRVQPSPAVALGPGAWGWSLAAGEAVGSFSPPPSITAAFNSTPVLWQEGPLVSMLYRGGGHNVFALRPVQDSSAASSWALMLGQRDLLAGNHSAYWGVFDLTRDYGAAFEMYNVVTDAHDYVVSVQGCYLPGVQLERLYFVTRTGRSLQFGRGYCTAWFRQDAPRGGYLAAVAGWSLNQTLWPSGPPYDTDVAFIYQIRPIWAVPPGGSAPPPMAVDLPPQLPAGGGACPSSRPPVAASARQLGLPGECGAATGAVCNSNQCCGSTTWGRNRLYMVCGTGLTPCQTGCMAGYGMCGALPDRPLLTFVRPPSPPLSSYAPLLLDASNTPLVVNGSRVVNWTSTVTSPSAALAAAPLSGSNPHQPLPLLYFLKTDGAVTYAEALAYCNSSTHLGLSWEMVGLPDSLGFTVSGTMRRGAYTAIKDTVMWFLSDPDYVDAAPSYACMRGKFGPQPSQFYDMAIVGPGPCGITAAAMCRAVGLTSTNTSAALASQLRQLQQQSGAAAGSVSTSPWKSGRHAVWLSSKRGAGPFSSGSCGFALAAAPQLEAALIQQLASFTADAAAPAGASPLPANGGNTTASGSTASATTSNSTVATASTVATSISLPGTYIGDFDVASSLPPLAGLSLSRASFSDNSSDASDLIAGLRLHLTTTSLLGPPGGDTARAAGVASSGGWEGMALEPGEVVVAVSVCAGGFVERLVLHTSTGRLLTHAWGRHARCTRGFTEAAPAGGYLLGMAGHVGSYVEDLALAWGSPLPSPPPNLPPPPAPPVVDAATGGGATGSTNTTSSTQLPLDSSSGSSGSNNTGIIVGAVVGGTVLLMGLLAAALLLLRRRRRSQQPQQHVPQKPSGASSHACGPNISIELGTNTSGSGSYEGRIVAVVAPVAGGSDGSSAASVTKLARKASAGAGAGRGGDGAPQWVQTDNSLCSSLRDTGEGAALSTASVIAGTAAAGAAAVRQEATIAAAGHSGGGGGGTPRGGQRVAPAAAGVGKSMVVGMGVLVAAVHDDLDADLDLDGDLLGAHEHEHTTEDGDAQLLLGHGAAVAAAVGAAAGAAPGVAAALRNGGSSAGLRLMTGTGSGDGSTLASTASRTDPSATVSATVCGSASGVGTGHNVTDGSSLQAASQGSAGPDLSMRGGTGTWASPSSGPKAAAAVGDGSLAATTPRRGSSVGPSLTAQRVAADSSLTARGNLVPAHAGRAMEVVLAPGATGRAGSVTNLGRGSTGGGPHQMQMLAAIAASRGSVGADACSPAGPSSEQSEGPGYTVASTQTAVAATESDVPLAGPPPLMLGKNVVVDWKGILGRGCSCVVFRGTLTLPPPEGPAGAEGVNIPVAVKLLMHLAAAAVEEAGGAGPGAAAAPTSADDGSDRADGAAAAAAAVVAGAQLNPLALSPELRGQLRMLQAEVAVLSRLDHPNIVKYYGACLDPTTTASGAAGAAGAGGSSGSGLPQISSGAGDPASAGSDKSGPSPKMPPGMSSDMPFLVEELMHVPLSRVIHARQASGSGAFLHDYGLVDILRICRDVANALAYLHPTVVHRDLKPANVLLDERGTAKVGDFGLARFKAGTLLATTNVEVGTTPYMAPEIFAAGGEAAVSDKSDVFALGVLINEMVTRQRPWTGTRSAVVGYLVAIEGQRPAMAPADHPHCPPGLRSLIQRCWRQNPDERPSGAEIVKRLTLLLAEHAAAL